MADDSRGAYVVIQLTDETRTFAATADANISIAGFAFVNSSVTEQG